MKRYLSANTIGIAMTVALIGLLMYGVGVRDSDRVGASPAARLGAAGGPTTARVDLSRTIEQMERRLRARVTDGDAAILLADASIRQARVTGNRALTRRAVEALKPILADEPMDYEARRMLATAYAAEHRFEDALREATRAREQNPSDPWNYGIIGDSHLEQGEYEQAFAAFQKMLDLKPSSAAYARVSYAFEIQGQLDDAITAMKLAVDAASPRDPEAIAWLQAHLGELYMDVGRLPEARMAFAWGERVFPNHPFVRAGVAKLFEAEGDTGGAIRVYREQLEAISSPDLAAALGDVYARVGRRDEAERLYQLAESWWRSGGATEQDHLARFLADRDRKLEEAVRLAEASGAQDIVAQDALAWAYFKAGRLVEANQAAAQALRTGTRNVEILRHAAAIRYALGDSEGARAILDRAPRGSRRFVRAADAVQILRQQMDGLQFVASR